jgi:hypothetical protein
MQVRNFPLDQYIAFVENLTAFTQLLHVHRLV